MVRASGDDSLRSQTMRHRKRASERASGIASFGFVLSGDSDEKPYATKCS